MEATSRCRDLAVAALNRAKRVLPAFGGNSDNLLSNTRDPCRGRL